MTALGSRQIWILVPDWSRLKSSEPKAGDVTCKISPLYFNFSQKANHNVRKIKYRGPILRVMSPALGSDDLSLDQSGTSIQILPEPNAVTWHVFYKITTLRISSLWSLKLSIIEPVIPELVPCLDSWPPGLLVLFERHVLAHFNKKTRFTFTGSYAQRM